jgi:Gram-negative bacterial TonB protein C-terminal
LAVAIEPAFVPQLLKAKTLVFWNNLEGQEHFDLAAVERPAFDRWEKCIKALPRDPWSATSFASLYRRQMPLQPVSPINIGRWFGPNDYPSRAMREEREGVIAYTVEVGVNGRVNSCKSNAQIGIDSPDLISATCSNASRRGRFIPATDANGRPFTSSWSGRVRWQIPYD